MSKTKKLLIALMLLIAVLLIPNMVNATNEQPKVSTEVYGANKSIKVTLKEIVLNDTTNEYKFGISKTQATEPTEWLDLQNIETNECTTIITPENETHRSILRSSDKCYIFIKDVTNNEITIKTQVDLSLPKESALNITLTANRDFNISYLYRNASNIGSYYITAVKIDNREIIQKYLEAKNNNENTLNAVKNMLPTDISSNNSWKEMTTPGTYDYAYYYNGELTKNQGLYMIWGQVSYSEGRNIYGYVLYDNYPNGYVLPEEGKKPAPKVESIIGRGDSSNLTTIPGTVNLEFQPTVGDEITINVKFDQDIVKKETPKLTIKFGTGSNIEITTCEASSNTLTYKYTIKEGDLGALQIVSFAGGNVTNNERTAAVLTLPELSGIKVVAVEGSETPKEPETTNKKTFNNHSYQIIDRLMSWQEAKEHCESLGGYLVTITSAEEQEFIASFVKEQGFTKNRFWMGATDKDKEGTWKWITEEKYNYTNWGNAQPNDGEAGGQDYGVYVGIDSSEHSRYAGKWDDINEDSEEDIYFICEWGEVEKETTTNPPLETDKDIEADKDKTKDNTTAKDELPKTGRVLLFWIIGIVTVSGTAAFVRYKKLYM